MAMTILPFTAVDGQIEAATPGGNLEPTGPPLAMPLGAGQSSVWTGSTGYMFSGFAGTSGITDRIIEWSPGGESRILDVRFPQPMRGPKAVWTGSEAYMAGGWLPPNDGSSGVFRFDPAGPTLTRVASLPVEVDINAVIWSQGSLYMIGGDTLAGPIDDIYKFTPGKGLGVEHAGRLATGPIEWGAYAEVAAKLYLIGGDDWQDDRGHPLDTIIEFDPATLEARTMRTRLPAAMTDVSTVSDGTYIYIIGGRSGWKPGQVWRSSIDIYEPRLDVMFHSCAGLPEPLSNAAVFARGPGDLLIVGGVKDGITPTRDAYNFRWSLAGLPPAELATVLAGSLDCLSKPILADDLDVCNVLLHVKDVLPAGMLDTIPMGRVGSLTVRSDAGGAVQTAMSACDDLSSLAPTLPSLPGSANGAEAIYVRLDSPGAQLPGDGQVRVELDYGSLLPEGTTAAEVDLHYHDGTQWVEVETQDAPDDPVGTEGPPAPSGIDAERKVVWAVVDDLGTFALVRSGGLSGADPTGSHGAAAAAPLVMVGLLVAGLARKRRRPDAL